MKIRNRREKCVCWYEQELTCAIIEMDKYESHIKGNRKEKNQYDANEEKRLWNRMN